MNILNKATCGITFLCLFFLFPPNYGYAQKIRVMTIKDTATFVNNSGDSSQVYSAYIYTGQLNAIGSVTLVSSVFNPVNSQWIVQKDTSYAWSQVTAPAHNNNAYEICKPNLNMLRLCLGRLHYQTRRKFKFIIKDNTNSITNKEIHF